MADSVAAILLALAFGDLCAGGLAGSPGSWRRAALGALASCAAWFVAEAAVAPNLVSERASLLIPALCLWYFTRLPGANGKPRACSPYLSLGSLALLFLPTLVGAVVAGSRAGAAASQGAGASLLMIVAVAALQGPTANAIVREVLELAEVDFRRSQPKLRGGRFIGLFERWLIVGLASFDLTAAALVVSAKSLLRFPELSNTPAAPSDSGLGLAEMTEYFLLGSLVSWTVALASVGLLRLSS